MRLDISRAIESVRLALVRSRPALTAAAGKLAGLALGALGGSWYGALVGLALGAMLDGARKRRRAQDADVGSGTGSRDAKVRERDASAAMLGVPVDAPPSAIKRAFRAISKESHPDGPTPDPERFMAARKAYETLLSSPGVARSGPRAT